MWEFCNFSKLISFFQGHNARSREQFFPTFFAQLGKSAFFNPFSFNFLKHLGLLIGYLRMCDSLKNNSQVEKIVFVLLLKSGCSI